MTAVAQRAGRVVKRVGCISKHVYACRCTHSSQYESNTVSNVRLEQYCSLRICVVFTYLRFCREKQVNATEYFAPSGMKHGTQKNEHNCTRKGNQTICVGSYEKESAVKSNRRKAIEARKQTIAVTAIHFR